MSDLYCDAVIRLFTVGSPPGPDGMGPAEFASLKGDIQRTLLREEALGRLVWLWSNLTVVVNARTLEILGLDTPRVSGGAEEILEHAVGEMNAARRKKPDLTLGPMGDGIPPGPVCQIRGPVHDDVHSRMIHREGRPWTLTSGRLSQAIGIQLHVTLPLYPFDRTP